MKMLVLLTIAVGNSGFCCVGVAVLEWAVVFVMYRTFCGLWLLCFCGYDSF